MLRRQINDLVMDGNRLSLTKTGMLAGQTLAIKLILEHGAEIIANWDSLTVLFSVLIAPRVFSRVIEAKFGGGDAKDDRSKS